MADQANAAAPLAAPATNGAPPAGGAPPANTNNEGASKITLTPELTAWAKAKGYEDFDALATANPTAYRMATSYREAEKFIGGDKIPLPKDMNDKAALRTVFEKLGAPAAADGYKLTTEGQNTDFTKFARGIFFDAGVTQAQAEVLNTGWNGFVDGLLKNDDTATQERAAADKIGLEKDWGGKMQENVAVADRARNMLSAELGIPRDTLTDKFEEVFGLRDASRILHFLGTKAQVTGDSFEGGEHNADRGGGGQIMSAEDAKAEKARLFADPKFVKDYRARDASARGRVDSLNASIAGTMPSTPPKVTNGPPGKR